MLFLSCFCYAFERVCFFDALWSPAGKGLTSWLSFVIYNCEVITFQARRKQLQIGGHT